MTNTAQAPKTVTASLDMTEGSLKTEIQARRHRFAADEAPPACNSTDEHPTPTTTVPRWSRSLHGHLHPPLRRSQGVSTDAGRGERRVERRPAAVEGGQADHITRTITLHGDRRTASE